MSLARQPKIVNPTLMLTPVINDDPPGDPWFCENPDCRSELARVVTRTHAGQPVKMLLFLVPQPGPPQREHEALVYFGTVPVKCGACGSVRKWVGPRME